MIGISETVDTVFASIITVVITSGIMALIFTYIVQYFLEDNITIVLL